VHTLHLQVLKLTYPSQPSLANWGQQSDAAQRSIYSIPAAQFYDLHPFHLIMDTQLQLLQWGAAIGRVEPDLRVGQHVRESFRVRTGCFNQASIPCVHAVVHLPAFLRACQAGRRGDAPQHACMPGWLVVLLLCERSAVCARVVLPARGRTEACRHSRMSLRAHTLC
jgi:hypothetical protein